MNIPAKTEVDIVTKAYFHESFDNVGFSTFTVLLAIGGFKEDPHGIHKSGICFSTLFYNKDAELITLEFHEEFR